MMFELWDTTNEFMGSLQAFIGWMAKSLMPQDMFSLSTDGIDIGSIGNHCIKREVRKFWWE